MMVAEDLYTEDCIRTFTGQYVNVFDTDPNTISIEDIAHALSTQPRFGGHMPYPYSVAQHSASCVYMLETDLEFKLEALMHDASEAYLMDIPKPIKKRLSNYKEIEDGLMKVIAEKFGFQWPVPEKIKEIDELILQYEWDGWVNGGEIEYWKPERAKRAFYDCFTLYRRK